MSAVRLFGFVIVGLLILFIFGAGTIVTVDRGMSAAQRIGLVILGLPILFIIGVGAVLTYVRVANMGQSVREALPSGRLLDMVVRLTGGLVIIVLGAIPVGEAIYERFFEKDGPIIKVTEVAPLDDGLWWDVGFENAVVCEGTLLLATSVARSRPSPDCDGTPTRSLRFHFDKSLPEGAALTKIEALPGSSIRGARGEGVDPSFAYFRLSAS